jgi:hypothetical protein
VARARPAGGARRRVSVGRHLHAQGRLPRDADARRAALAAGRCAGGRRGDRLAARARAGRLGGARGGGAGLLAVRARADLDVHGVADRRGLGRPRGPVAA